MAKSSNFNGLRRGSTKSHTFSVLEGKQITKDRVEGGKNPRSPKQMAQRCCMTTSGNASSATKCITDHSFEGKTAGSDSLNEFNSRNLKKLRLCKEYGNGFFGFNKYQDHGLVAGSYIIADGSLPIALVDAEVESVSVADNKVTVALVSTTGGTIADVAEPMGCMNFGDMCTVCVMYPKADGFYGFGAVRFTYKSGASVLESFDVAVTGDIVSATPTFASNTLKVELRMSYDLATGATVDKTYMASITSRYVNGKWLRSYAQFLVEEATPTFAEAIATYPVGQARFLNGGSANAVAPSGGGGDDGGGDGGGGDDGGGDDGGDDY